MEIVMDANQS